MNEQIQRYSAHNKIDHMDISILLAESRSSSQEQVLSLELDIPRVAESLTTGSDVHCLTVRLAALHRLPGLFDCSQYRVI